MRRDIVNSQGMVKSLYAFCGAAPAGHIYGGGVDGKSYEFLAHKWRVVDVDGQNVLLFAVHASECSDMIGPAIGLWFGATVSGRHVKAPRR